MKNQIIITVCLVLSSCILAQAQSNRVKLFIGQELSYQNQMNEVNYPNEMPTISRGYGYDIIWGLAVEHHKANGRFWEVSVTGGGLTKYNSSQIVLDSTGFPSFITFGTWRNPHAKVQLEFNRPLCIESTSKFMPYFGLFFRASAAQMEFVPDNSQVYPQKSWETFLSAGFVPRLQIVTKSRIKIDFSAPLNLIKSGVVGSKIENPSVSPSQHKTTTFDLSVTLETQFRIGIGYQIGKKKE